MKGIPLSNLYFENLLADEVEIEDRKDKASVFFFVVTLFVFRRILD